MNSGWWKRLSASKADIIVFLALLVAAVKYVAGVDHVVDVLFYDESLYLVAGVKLAARGLYCPECGPLYAPLYNAWYFLLSHLTHDNLSLYWLNYKLMAVLPALLIYILLRKNNVSMLASAAIAVLILTSSANLPVWPKPSHMGIIVTLAFLIPASTTRSVPAALGFAAAGAFISSYVRPEYFLTSVLLGLWLAGWIVWTKAWRDRTATLPLAGVLVLAAAVIGAIGLPVSGSRSICAFGQHFALYWVAWTGSDLHPWVDWQTIFTQNFGDAHGMLDVIRNNPHMFLKHVGANVVGLVKNFGMLFPVHLFGDKIAKIGIVAVVAWLFVVRRASVRAMVREHRTYLFIVALFLLAGLISIVTVFPRPHYFVYPVFLITSTLALLLTGRQTPEEPRGVGYALLLSGLILAVTPSPYLNLTDDAQVNTRAIRLVQGLHITKPVRILEAEGGFDIYMGDNFQRVGEAEKDRGFKEFLAARDINMVVVTDLLASDLRFRNDPEWQAFLASPQDQGFRQYAVPAAKTKVFVRKDLLP